MRALATYIVGTAIFIPDLKGYFLCKVSYTAATRIGVINNRPKKFGLFNNFH